MAFMVRELARLTGVTVRTLHHYDEIGLCQPSRRSPQGYRLYDDSDVLRLQQVLVLRELGLPLDEIAAVIDREPDRGVLLRKHRAALVEKRGRLDVMLSAVDAALRALEGGNDMQPEDVTRLFEGFNPAEHEDEAEQRWGTTEAYKESARRTKGYTSADWERYKTEAAAIGTKLADFMRAGTAVTDAEVQAAVEEHRLLIDRWFYPCSTELHKALAAMYVADARFTANLEKFGAGYAQFLSDAITAS